MLGGSLLVCEWVYDRQLWLLEFDEDELAKVVEFIVEAKRSLIARDPMRPDVEHRAK